MKSVRFLISGIPKRAQPSSLLPLQDPDQTTQYIPSLESKISPLLSNPNPNSPSPSTHIFCFSEWPSLPLSKISLVTFYFNGNWTIVCPRPSHTNFTLVFVANSLSPVISLPMLTIASNRESSKLLTGMCTLTFTSLPWQDSSGRQEVWFCLGGSWKLMWKEKWFGLRSEFLFLIFATSTPFLVTRTVL